MFQDANVNNRSRHLVRGRVLVATTSKVVEFLQENLKISYPLYSVENIPAGYLLVFSVEMNGFLTFDEGSLVRILTETGAFEKLQYDPKAFALVKAADPSSIVSHYVNYAENNPSATYARVVRTVAGGLDNEETFFPVQMPASLADLTSLADAVFVTGNVYRGAQGYPAFTQYLNAG